MHAVNLLPVEERGGPRSSGSRSLNGFHALAAIGAIVVVALLGTWAVARSHTASARDATAAAVARSAAAQAQVDQLAPVVALDTRRAARETAVLQLAAGRTDWAMVLRAVAGALPRQVSVTTLSLQAADAATAAGTTTAAPAAGLAGNGSVALTACADSQPRVATALRALRNLPQVADVALNQTSRSSSGTGASEGAGCAGVTVDADLGLSDATVIDGTADAASAASGAATTTSAGGAAATAATTTTTTTGTSR